MTATLLDLWRGNAARLHHGVCDDCGRVRMVARQHKARRFQCVECFTRHPTGASLLCKLARRARREQAVPA